ncbi:MAG: DUF167 family protein [Candidatus Spechtbacterales bacterium]
MKISVRVRVGSSVTKIEKIEEGSFLAYIKARPEKGKANKALAAALGEYFNIPPSSIRIISGQTSKNKIVELL